MISDLQTPLRLVFEYLFSVAQVSNLLYRRFPIGMHWNSSKNVWILKAPQAGSTAIQQVGNLRYVSAHESLNTARWSRSQFRNSNLGIRRKSEHRMPKVRNESAQPAKTFMHSSTYFNTAALRRVQFRLPGSEPR
jgi:hypothetical protein